MNDDVLATLAELLSEHTLSLLDQPRRLEGMLRDLHPDAPRAVSVLVEACARGVGERLQAEPRAQQQPLVAMLTEGSGLALRPATWAVDGWRALLGGTDPTQDGDQGGHDSLIANRPGTLEDVLAGTMERR